GFRLSGIFDAAFSRLPKSLLSIPRPMPHYSMFCLNYELLKYKNYPLPFSLKITTIKEIS
ncbi:MAG: hypothetical protein LBM77_03515, partial [Spirochaetaceae bacterium]|nr:hypothetical protein [Spirochaetaceae bacterium]